MTPNAPPDDQQPGIATPVGILMASENRQQHDSPTEKPEKTDMPDIELRAEQFHKNVERGKQQRGRQHEERSGHSGVKPDFFLGFHLYFPVKTVWLWI